MNAPVTPDENPLVSAISTGLPRLMEGLQVFRESVGYYPDNTQLMQSLYDQEIRYVIEWFVSKVTEGSVGVYRDALVPLVGDKTHKISRVDQIQLLWRDLETQGILDQDALIAIWKSVSSKSLHMRADIHQDFMDEKHFDYMAYRLFDHHMGRLIDRELAHLSQEENITLG